MQYLKTAAICKPFLCASRDSAHPFWNPAGYEPGCMDHETLTCAQWCKATIWLQLHSIS